MTHYCVHVGIQDTNLNNFPHSFTRRLRVCNPVLFSASVSTAVTCAVWVPAGSTGGDVKEAELMNGIVDQKQETTYALK